MDLRILAITLPLLAATLAVSLRRKSLQADWTAIAGLACTLIGDYFLAMKHAPRDSMKFICGVAGFALAHACWMAHLLRGKRLPQLPVLLGLLAALLPYLHIRVLPNTIRPVGTAIVVYTILSCASLACALASGKPLWMIAIGALFVSDFFISAGTFTDDPLLGRYVVRFYLLALVATAVATIFPKPAFKLPYNSLNNKKLILIFVALSYLLSVSCFVGAMARFPGGRYDFFHQMLSHLGRRTVNGAVYPVCHYLFVLAMGLSALSFALATPQLARLVRWPRLGWLAEMAGALFAGGLAMIALLPEDINGAWHCHGCNVAALGGGLFIVLLWPRRREWLLVGEIFCVAAAFAVCLKLHGAGRLAFAPAIPTLQKALVGSFMLWGIWQCAKAFLGEGRAAKPTTDRH